eukprot:m.369528 g.369528  ORF g.369528 m.369528 type:complete len:123 (+) comp16678_c0_seq2:384-752(+)
MKIDADVIVRTSGFEQQVPLTQVTSASALRGRTLSTWIKLVNPGQRGSGFMGIQRNPRLEDKFASFFLLLLLISIFIASCIVSAAGEDSTSFLGDLVLESPNRISWRNTHPPTFVSSFPFNC